MRQRGRERARARERERERGRKPVLIELDADKRVEVTARSVYKWRRNRVKAGQNYTL